MNVIVHAPELGGCLYEKVQLGGWKSQKVSLVLYIAWCNVITALFTALSIAASSAAMRRKEMNVSI